MSLKKVFAYFIIISLQLTGCSNSHDYQDNIDIKETTYSENVELQNATSNLYYGKLHVNGTFLSDKNNNPVQLKGISSHGIAWFPQYINKDTFKTFKDDWNVNVIRLSMYTEDTGGYCSSDDDQKQYLKSLIYKGIDAAKELNMYVIVDWHTLSDKNPLTHVDEAIKFFDEVSSKYGNDPHILYEICNEPSGETSWKDIKAYSNKVIPIIRNNAPDSIIIVGTPNSSQDVDIASKSPIENYDNIMYSLHFYADTHKDDLRNKMHKAVENGLPIFVTEYGICDASGNGNINILEATKWINALNENKISYVAWNLSNKDESSAILNPSTEKTSDFSSSDLSESGEWIKYMLTKNYSKGDNKDYIDENDFIVEDSKEKIQSENSTNDNTSNISSNNSTNIEEDLIKSISTSSNLSASVNLESSWEESGKMCYLYRVSLTNSTSNIINDWTINIELNNDIELISFWNSSATLSSTSLILNSLNYNKTINSNSSIYDIGFIIKVK